MISMSQDGLGFSITSALKTVGKTAIRAQGTVFKTVGVASKIPGVAQGANAIVPGSGKLITAGGQIDDIVGSRLMNVGKGGGKAPAQAGQNDQGGDIAPSAAPSKSLVPGISNKTLAIAGGGLVLLVLLLKR